MKTRTIISLSLIALGLIVTILGFTSILGEGGGYLVIGLGYPLILLGIILLFSLVGTLIIVAGIILLNIGTRLMPIQSSAITQTTFAWIVGILLVIGILYGVVEGIIKLVKRYNK